MAIKKIKLPAALEIQAGHAFEVEPCERPDGLPNGEDFTRFYRATLNSGRSEWYLAKGYASAPREIVVWYPSRKMWHSYGTSLQSALEGAVTDAFLYV